MCKDIKDWVISFNFLSYVFGKTHEYFWPGPLPFFCEPTLTKNYFNVAATSFSLLININQFLHKPGIPFTRETLLIVYLKLLGNPRTVLLCFTSQY